MTQDAESNPFEFHNPGKLIDDELRLILIDKYLSLPIEGVVPVYRFKMTRVGSLKEIGRIHLRIGNTRDIVMYDGHVGYRVHPEYQGYHYAARSCCLLLPLARSHGIKTLWITADPDNFASRRTCELIGAELVEIVNVPFDRTVALGRRQKCRYRLAL